MQRPGTAGGLAPRQSGLFVWRDVLVSRNSQKDRRFIQLGDTSMGQSRRAARASELNLAVDDFRQVQAVEKSSDRLEIP
jgi:hypothetical protein